MCDIAATAGISEKLLYRYFQNKAALADAVAKRATAGYQTFVADAKQRFGKGRFTVEDLTDFGMSYSRFLEETYYLRCCWHSMPERFADEEQKIAYTCEALRRLLDSMFERLAIGRSDQTRARTLAYLHALEAYVTTRVRLPAVYDPPFERYVADTTSVFASL